MRTRTLCPLTPPCIKRLGVALLMIGLWGGGLGAARAGEVDDPAYLLTTLSFAGRTTTAKDIVALPDGGWVVLAHATDGVSGWLVLAAFQPDGTPHPGFGAGGQLVFDAADVIDVGGLARMADGRLVAAATAHHSGHPVPLVVRVNPDGTPDTTFNGQGWRLDPFWPYWTRANAVAVQPDGKIVIGGSARNFWDSGDAVFLVARYLQSGGRDTTFGGLDPTFNDLAGKVVLDWSPRNDESVNALLVQSDGRIVVAGGGDDDRMHLLRLLPNGALDTSFGGGTGMVTDYHTGPANALQRLQDGSYLVAGNSPAWRRIQGIDYDEFDKFGYVHRYFADGTPDYAMRLQAQNFPNTAQSLRYVGDVVALARGKFAVVGHLGDAARTFAVAVHNPDGSFDSGVGEEGVIRLETGTRVLGTAIAAAGLSRLVVAGLQGDDALVGTVDGVFSEFAVSFTSASYLTSEGAEVARVGIRLGAPQAATVSVRIDSADGTATAGADYLPVSTVITFAPGETLKVVDVPVLSDTVLEGAETVLLTLSDPVGLALGSPRVATLTIEDSPRVSIRGELAYEGNGVGRAWVQLSALSPQPVIVSYAFVGGTATPGIDYDATPGQVTIPTGAWGTVIEIPLLQDDVAEPEETIEVSIQSAVHATVDPALGRATVVVVDDIAQCTVCPVVTVSERDAFAAIPVVSASGGVVAYRTIDVTATAGADYTATVGSVSLPLDAVDRPIPQTILIPIRRDTVYDPDETFLVLVSGQGPVQTNGIVTPLVIVRITDGAIVVGTTEQTGGPCSLASAIRSANDNQAYGGCLAGVAGEPDLIVVPAGHYVLSSIDHFNTTTTGGAVGLPAIRSPIIIEGAGADQTIVERAPGAPAFRHIEVLSQAGSSLTVRRLTLKGALIVTGPGVWGRGGSVYAEGPLTVEDARFEANRASDEGGAVFAGQATIRRTSFVDNVAHVGGAIGGGWLSGTIAVEDSRFERNRAGDAGGAIGACGSLTIDRSTFAGNAAVARGGAVRWQRCGGTVSATFTLRDSTFLDNLAGSGDLNGSGGAIEMGFGESATLLRNRFIGNRTNGEGGAIKAAGGLIADSYFSRNRALRGGAVTTEAAALEIRGSTFEGNEAGDYGGALVVQYSAPVTVTNVTITGNVAAGQGGGIAYSSHTHPFTLQNVTIADNHAGWRGGGIWFYAAGHEIRLRNTIVARNTTGSTNWPDLGSDGKTYTSQGHNLIGNRKNAPYIPAATDLVGTDQAPIDPRLGPLAGYGGLTPTRALLPDSPAIDTGSPLPPGSDPLACAATDQRGFARPGSGSAGCDIGAFERTTLAGPALAVSKTQAEGIAYVGHPVVYRITLVNNGDAPVHGVVATDQAPAGLSLSSATASQGTCQATAALASCQIGTVAPGALVTMDVTATALVAGVLHNGVHVTADASAGLPPGGLTAMAPVSSREPIVVTTLAQSPGGTGDCTLGEAIQAANTDAAVDGCRAGHGTDLILLPSGTLLMTAVAHSDGYGATALPIITSPVEIRGQGAEQTIVERDSLAPDMRLFRATSDVTLSQLAVRGGRAINANGGGWFGGSLTTAHVRFENNYTSHEGGAVHTGTLVARDTRFSGNRAGGWGGGGAVKATTARIVDTVFAGNRADSIGGGALNVCQEGNLLRTSFEGNQGMVGGGVYANCGTSAVRITDSVFLNNQALHGGAIHGGGVGAFYVILRTQFLGNRATGDGGAGGAAADISGSIVDSTFSGNTATYGGAVKTAASITIVGSTFDANVAWIGGGLYLTYNQNVTIVNTTITENRANHRAGGIYSEGASTRALTFNNVTLSHNVAADVFGGVLLFHPSSNARVANSIFAANVGGTIPDCYNAAGFTSEGHNLIGNGNYCWGFSADPTSRVGTATLPIDPGLGPLANNGGPTLTRALLPGSPALDAGSPLVPGSGLAGACAGVDQRGVPRPGRGTPRCDIGAYEAVATIAGADLAVEASLSGAAEAGVEATYTVLVRNLGPDTAFASNLTVLLPESARFVSATTTQGVTSQPGRQVIFHLGSLAPGATATLAVTLVPTAIGTFEILATATSAVGDPDAANNAVATPFPVVAAIDLALHAVSPARGGNRGRLIVWVQGAGFRPGLDIRLRRPDGSHLRPVEVGLGDNGLTAGAMFDLTGEVPGRLDLLVINPDGRLAVLEGGFAVETAREPRLVVDVLGPTVVRLGQTVGYEYTVTNIGDADIYGVELEIRVPGLNIRFPNPPRHGPVDEFFGGAVSGLSPLMPWDPPASIWGSESNGNGSDGDLSRQMAATKIHIPHIRAGERVSFPVEWTAGPQPKRYLFSGVTVGPLLRPESPGGVASAGSGWEEPAASGPWSGGAAEPAASASSQSASSEACSIGLVPSACVVAGINAGMNALGLTPLGPVAGCVAGLLSSAVVGPLLGVCSALDGGTSWNGWRSAVDTSATFVSKFLGIATACGTGALSQANPAASFFAFAGSLMQTFTECVDPETADTIYRHTVDLWVEVVTSADPNAKVGPAGAGPGNHLQGDRPFPYVVLFENKPDATAAAQEVVITDHLDTDVLDLSTFSFGAVAFGETRVELPPGTDVTVDVDLRPAQDLIVRIHAFLDAQTGVVTWRFASLDPLTGEPTTDVYAGFLPPNLTSPEGEGRVTFFVSPKPDLAHGTEIRNEASIVFDLNEPIVTNEWLVTIDTEAPESHVRALAPVQSSSTFTVEWSGTDDGAGIRDYTVYVSENGAAFRPWIVETPATSATFVGTPNATYRFYSIARDGAGNIELDRPADGDTTTTVARAAIQFAAEAYAIGENVGVVQVVVTRSGNLDPEVSVQYQVAGVSATAGEDFASVQGTVTFASEQTLAVIEIPILDDAMWEPEETFVVTLSVPSQFALVGVPATATVTIVDNDNRAPEANAGGDRTVEATSPAGALVVLDGSGSTDPDGDVLAYQWRGAFGTADGVVVSVPLPLGTSAVTLEVSDGQGGTATDTVQVTVIDTTAPAIDVPADRVVEATSAAGAVVTFAAAASDAVSAPTLAYTPEPGTTFPLGLTVVTVTATDAAGNTATAAFTVTVVDTVAPILTAPANVVLEATSAAGAVATFAATATDAVSTPTISYSREPGSTFPIGTTTVTVTATDAAGNTATATFTVTVADTTAPALPLLPDIGATVTDETGGPVFYTVGSATDLVDGAVALACEPASGSFFPVGDTTVACRATDRAGNAAAGTFVLSVRLVAPPDPVPIAGVLVNRVPLVNGTVTGSLQVRLPQHMLITGNGVIRGDLLVPGTPQVRTLGRVGGSGPDIVDGPGEAQPFGHVILVSGRAAVDRIVRRTDPIPMPMVAAPLPPAGTRDVVLARRGASAGEWGTVRHVTISGNVGDVIIPPGAYGRLTVHGRNRVVVGVAGSTTPSLYHFQSMAFADDSRLDVAGPVVITVGASVSVRGLVGNPAHPEWLTLGIHAGGLTVTGDAEVHGTVLAPSGTVAMHGTGTVVGVVAADRLEINGNWRFRAWRAAVARWWPAPRPARPGAR